MCSLTRRSRLSFGAAAGQGGGLQAWHSERRVSGSKRPAAAHRSPPPAEDAHTALAERGSERVATRPHTSGFRPPNLKRVLADWSLARRGLTGTKRLERANNTESLVGGKLPSFPHPPSPPRDSVAFAVSKRFSPPRVAAGLGSCPWACLKAHPGGLRLQRSFAQSETSEGEKDVCASLQKPQEWRVALTK